jgi:hypothetical protein
MSGRVARLPPQSFTEEQRDEAIGPLAERVSGGTDLGEVLPVGPPFAYAEIGHPTALNEVGIGLTIPALVLWALPLFGADREMQALKSRSVEQRSQLPSQVRISPCALGETTDEPPKGL